MKYLEVRWIIEKDVLSYTDNLIKYLKEKDIYYKETTYQEVVSHKYSDKYGSYLSDHEVATIFVGSLRLAKEINRYPICPGAICNLKNFDCLNYYPSWNDDYLLNKDWTITVLPILKRHTKQGDIAKKFFFRPNEGDKMFTGGLYTKSQLVNMRLQDSRVIIQASKKDIVDERRFLIVDRRIVDNTRYLDTPKSNGLYQAGKRLLEDALRNPRTFIPDKAFTVDIGETKRGDIGVIELNSFSCANLYSMNMDKVVPAINDLAKQMYIEEND
jgi:hypothetical protein